MQAMTADVATTYSQQKPLFNRVLKLAAHGPAITPPSRLSNSRLVTAPSLSQQRLVTPRGAGPSSPCAKLKERRTFKERHGACAPSPPTLALFKRALGRPLPPTSLQPLPAEPAIVRKKVPAAQGRPQRTLVSDIRLFGLSRYEQQTFPTAAISFLFFFFGTTKCSCT
jgi:hypothetical protein